MKKRKYAAILLWVWVLSWSVLAEADSSSPLRFTKGNMGYGLDVGYGFGFNLPTSEDRTDSQFVFFAPNVEYDLTGNINEGKFYQGNLNLLNEITLLVFQHPETGVLAGWSPMLEYKFIKPARKWAPTFLAGIGFSYTDFNRNVREITGDFQFLLHAGIGIDFYDTFLGDVSVNYRLLHISNAGIESPNTGLNTGVISLGFTF
ncbi:MAG: acyloxyacyl hydrolase [Nitrospinota bacterium]|nr:acyloxyacyl hydrolase [Nitrospinota bacterium]